MGYTGMQPEEFRRLVCEIAGRKRFDESRLILGGDHLGPNPWQRQSGAEAMKEAQAMVQAYVRAGFQKIHLDASMSYPDDPHPLPGETVHGVPQPCAQRLRRRLGHRNLCMLSAPRCRFPAALRNAWRTLR